MKLKILSLCVLFLFLAAGVTESQTVNFRFGTHFYTWQKYDSLSTTGNNTFTTHMRGYQNYLLEMNKGKWSFNTLAQTEEDVVKKVDRGFAYRFYNLYIKGTNLFNVLDLKLGRQYVTAGAGRGTIDGAYLKLKFGKEKQFQIAGYGGYLTPWEYDFQNYPALKDNFSVGGQLLFYGVKDLSVGLSYNLKKRKPESYYAPRADSLFYGRNVLIDVDSRADQMAGLDLNYLDAKHNHNFFAKVYYDLNRNLLSRGEFNARFSISNQVKVSAGYSYREPQLSYNTIFWVFDVQKNQELETGLDYILKHNLNLFARVSDVFYNTGNSLKFQLGVSHPSFGLSLIKYTGYAGESDGVYGYFNHDVVKNLLAVTSSLNYSKYKISEYSSDRLNSFSGLLGLVYRPIPQLSFDLQGQFLTNRIYTFDTRVLFGFNYWLFKKL
jgi:hypothetical protein